MNNSMVQNQMSHSEFVRSSFAFSNKWSDRHQSPIQIEVIPCPEPRPPSPAFHRHSKNSSPPLIQAHSSSYLSASSSARPSSTIEQRNLGTGFACHWTIQSSGNNTTRKFLRENKASSSNSRNKISKRSRKSCKASHPNTMNYHIRRQERASLQDQLYRSMFETLVGNSELEKIESSYQTRKEQRKKSQDSLEWVRVEHLVNL